MTFGVFPPVLRSLFEFVTPAAAPASDWWEVAGKTCVAAYQAIGAASLAASYTNLANPGTYDAAPGTAPTFSAGTGWTFNGSTQHLFGPDVTPDNTWSAFVRFSGAGVGALFGCYDSGEAFTVLPDTTFVAVYNGADYPSGVCDNTPSVTGGVYGFAGRTVYRDGVAEPNTIPGTGGSTPLGLNIGRLNPALGYYISASIQAVVIYSDTLTAGEVATVSAAMAALTG